MSNKDVTVWRVCDNVILDVETVLQVKCSIVVQVAPHITYFNLIVLKIDIVSYSTVMGKRILIEFSQFTLQIDWLGMVKFDFPSDQILLSPGWKYPGGQDEVYEKCPSEPRFPL